MKKYGCYFVALMGATALTPQMALAQDITSESDESHATDTGLGSGPIKSLALNAIG